MSYLRETLVAVRVLRLPAPGAALDPLSQRLLYLLLLLR
jgi:hypothetical protein